MPNPQPPLPVAPPTVLPTLTKSTSVRDLVGLLAELHFVESQFPTEDQEKLAMWGAAGRGLLTAGKWLAKPVVGAGKSLLGAAKTMKNKPIQGGVLGHMGRFAPLGIRQAGREILGDATGQLAGMAQMVGAKGMASRLGGWSAQHTTRAFQLQQEALRDGRFISNMAGKALPTMAYAGTLPLPFAGTLAAGQQGSAPQPAQQPQLDPTAQPPVAQTPVPAAQPPTAQPQLDPAAQPPVAQTPVPAAQPPTAQPPVAAPAAQAPAGGMAAIDNIDVQGMMQERYNALPWWQKGIAAINPGMARQQYDQVRTDTQARIQAKLQEAEQAMQGFEAKNPWERFTSGFGKAGNYTAATQTSLQPNRTTRMIAARSRPQITTFKPAPTGFQPRTMSDPFTLPVKQPPGFIPALPERPMPNLVAPIQRAVSHMNERRYQNEQILNYPPKEPWWNHLLRGERIPNTPEPPSPSYGVAGARG